MSRERTYDATVARIEGQHGRDCPKVEHHGAGYLHGSDHDGPYDVDGVMYCGRCHGWVGLRVERTEPPTLREPHLADRYTQREPLSPREAQDAHIHAWGRAVKEGR